jgi:hypothetical protein
LPDPSRLICNTGSGPPGAQERTMVKPEYWNVDDAQVIEKTGQPLAHWLAVLDRFEASEKTSNDSVDHLQAVHGLGRYWARTLTTHYLKRRDA